MYILMINDDFIEFFYLDPGGRKTQISEPSVPIT